MSLDNNVFPQPGDPDDAARFAQLIGRESIVDYVVDGIEFTIDEASGELVVGSGLTIVSKDQDVALSDDKEISQLGYAVQTDSRTLSLPSSGEYSVVIDANLAETDNPDVDLYEDESNASDASLVVGELDTSGDSPTVTEYNRNPSGSFETITATNVAIKNTIASDQAVHIPSEHGMVVSGPLRVDGELGVDGSVTDSIGPIYGFGTISGSGRIKASGGRHIEPIDPEIDGNTFIVRSGWQTSLTEDSYGSYRFGNVATLKIEEDESLSFEV